MRRKTLKTLFLLGFATLVLGDFLPFKLNSHLSKNSHPSKNSRISNSDSIKYLLYPLKNFDILDLSKNFNGLNLTICSKLSAQDTKGVYIPQEVYFSYRSHRIPEVALDNLLELVLYLERHPEIQVFIQGYAKDGLSAKGDIDLSNRRADSVKRFLMVHGIESKRILAYGLGRSESKTDVLENARSKRFHRKAVIGLEIR